MLRLPHVAAVILVLIAASSAQASILIEITESGSDVLFTTTGSLNTTGLVDPSGTRNASAVSYNASGIGFETWIAFGSSGGRFDPGQHFYSGDEDGLVGYTSDVSWTGSSTSGLRVDLVSGLANFGFRTGDEHDIWIPYNYVSGTSVTQVLRRSNASFASLGLNAGDYAEVSWTGQVAGAGDSIRMQVTGSNSAVPEPATWLLWAAFGLIGVMASRRLR